MSKKTSTRNQEQLRQLSTEELVEIILTQQEVIEYLKQEVEKLKASRNLDSKTSSKPPSSDLLKKSEKKKKPGGQPGHKGKTRKGFGRVDRARSFKSKQLLPLWSKFSFSSSRQNRKTCCSATSSKPNRNSRVSTISS